MAYPGQERQKWVSLQDTCSFFNQCHTRAHPESVKCWLVSCQWARKGWAGVHMAITPSSSRGRGWSLALQNVPSLFSVTIGKTLDSESKDLNSCSGSVFSQLCDPWQIAQCLEMFSFIKWIRGNVEILGIFCKSTIVLKSGDDLSCLQEVQIGSGTVDYPVGETLLVWYFSTCLKMIHWTK